jgi:hypothetical protein
VAPATDLAKGLAETSARYRAEVDLMDSRQDNLWYVAIVSALALWRAQAIRRAGGCSGPTRWWSP